MNNEETKLKDCPNCDGEGRWWWDPAGRYHPDDPAGNVDGHWERCEDCGGTGQVLHEDEEENE